MGSATHLTIVIKLGTSSIVDETTHEPRLSILSVIVETAVQLRHAGHRVVIVSSGAIGVGLRRMDLDQRPQHLPRVQALAAVGQCRLMSLWDSLFGHLRQPVGQILITRNDIADRTQYCNAQNTLAELLDMGVIPIVNENDTLAVAEIKFGDNDTLSAITAAMVQADYLFLMTDVACLYDQNPRTHADARPIEVVADIASLDADVSSPGSSLGTGGMRTKIVAARLATSAGVTTIITRSSKPGHILDIIHHHDASPSHRAPRPVSDAGSAEGSASPDSADHHRAPPLHTRFLPHPQPIHDRAFWLLYGLAPHGRLHIDPGAYRALTVNKASGLLPLGVLAVHGSFAQQEAVRLVVVDGGGGSGGATGPVVERDVGRALVNYSATEIIRIMGRRSSEIIALLGYADSEYVAVRGNVAFFAAHPDGVDGGSGSGSGGGGGGGGGRYDGGDGGDETGVWGERTETKTKGNDVDDVDDDDG
ncbi:MAG: hypothetical protein M1826_003119 [Phylliscum demangeonii]|nr:MAG: hypothetical protein M1826_003119 [Phylliscum demangeonii]